MSKAWPGWPTGWWPNANRGLAIVMASHEPSLVEKVATRVIRLGDRARVEA